MPRKNKRKFFFGKSKNSKSAKLQNQNVITTTTLVEQQQNESDSEADEEEDQDNKTTRRKLQKSAVHSSISSVTNDSVLELGGGHIDSNSQLSLAEITATKMGSTSSTRWRSEPILNVSDAKENRKATITLKVIQFIPKAEVIHEDTQKFIDNVPHCDDDDDNHKSTTIESDTVTSDETIVEQILPSSKLHVAAAAAAIIGEVPKLDQQREDRRRRHFDDNYRVESPTNQQQQFPQHPQQSQIENRNKRRHAMLIQEISESSSSDEVKQFLDAEASALEIISEVVVPAKIYRVDSPESSSNDEANRCNIQSSSLVQEICESSSNESVKNEILTSLTKQPPPSSLSLEPGKIVTLKIINIKELPSEQDFSTTTTSSDFIKTPSSPIMKMKPIEKKLNKAEEAIMEALYGNPNLLQIPNTPLDVISEEGSDCSDIERHSKINQNDIEGDDDDDEVFLPPIDRKVAESASSKFRHRKRVMMVAKPPVEQPTMLINTRIVEAESNVPESCKSWETTAGDSELQAELVYLPSTSSSATDLSERSGDVTDAEDIEDTSEDTETNSLLENISVPSLYNIQQHDTKDYNVRILQQACELYHESEQLLPDISEEEEELSQQSQDIIESQQQIIEDVNKELHHLVREHHHGDVKREINRKEEEERQAKEVEEYSQVTELQEENDDVVEVEMEIKEENGAQINELQNFETNVIIVDDKKIIATTDNELQHKHVQQTSSNSGTPTQFRRKYSSDSSSSSANSQCTIIRQQIMPLVVDNNGVHPLKDLCMQSLQAGFNTDNSIFNDRNEAKITVQKKFNSISRNAPNIPIINELEMQFNDSHRRPSRENQRDKVITILQVPPDIKPSSSSSEINQVNEKERWYGLPSSQMPNLLLALSPMQKDYMMNSSTSQDTQQAQSSSSTSADVLLDMHKKFIERRAYHENSDDENSGTSRLAKVLKQQQKEDDENRSNDKIKSCVDDDHHHNDGNARDSPEKPQQSIEFESKKVELEDELKRLAFEQQELEEELKNIQSLQHFKREEFIFNQKKLEDELQLLEPMMTQNYANDNFCEFINSNEQLHQEIYNEWQDKVYQRNERKLQKSLKLTSINDDSETRSECAASEKFLPIRDEFIGKVKERQKRLSLPIDDNHNWDGSTESILNDDDGKTNFRKKKKKIHHGGEGNKENFPAHFREFLDYCEEEIAQTKNSVESGESKKKSLLIGLIGVASICICGFFVWKNSTKIS